MQTLVGGKNLPLSTYRDMKPILCVLALFCWLTSYGQKEKPLGSAVQIVINPSVTYQTIEHFGASDAWSCQFVGQWPDAKRNAIADLLFSRELSPNGQPKGIGLSLWRFNLGAGTAEQGTNSGIKDEWRRAESFLRPDGTYDWDKQAGQRWFLEAAKQRGVPYFLAFPNSPPVSFTTNGKGFATNKNPNLSPERYNDFADFMAQSLKGIQAKTGVSFNYISPVNEPQWDWSDGGQEGTPFYNQQIAGICRALNKFLVNAKLSTQINVAEAGQLEFLYSEHGRAGKGTQIQAFFDKNSPDYLGDLSQLTRAISGHSYFTSSPYDKAVNVRKQVLTELNKQQKVRYWMSEYCILGDNGGEINGSGKDLGISPAVYVATLIHNDLTHANATAWHWWLAISPYNYKDGLIYIEKNKTDGHFQPSKMLWALGNYSRFIRPGAVRVAVTLSQTNQALYASSYKNTDGRLVTVLVNASDNPVAIQPNVTSKKRSRWEAFTTSESEDLSPTPLSSNSLIIKEKSIVTLVEK